MGPEPVHPTPDTQSAEHPAPRLGVSLVFRTDDQRVGHARATTDTTRHGVLHIDGTVSHSLSLPHLLRCGEERRSPPSPRILRARTRHAPLTRAYRARSSRNPFSVTATVAPVSATTASHNGAAPSTADTRNASFVSIASATF